MSKTKNKPAREGLNGSATHLLHRALQLALDFHVDSAGPSAITQRQFTVLAAASTHDGTTQNDLVRATGIDRSTLADLVARMIAKGLLDRERSVTDARANTVRLSASGRTALDVASAAAGRADARLLALLAPKKRDALLKILAVLAEAADTPTDPAAQAPRPVKSAKKKKTKAKKTKEVGA